MTWTTKVGSAAPNEDQKNDFRGAFDLLGSVNPNYTGTLTGGTGVVNLGGGQFVKDGAGNVGIGAAPQGRKLEVWSENGTTDILTGSSSSGFGIVLRWNNSAGEGHLYTTGSYPLLLGTNGNANASIDASGNFELGTVTSTTGNFTVQKAAGYEPTVILNQAGVGAAKVYVPSGASALAFGVYNSGTINEVSRFDASGNLGVNTAVPQAKLHVNTGVTTNDTATKAIVVGSDRNDYYASINSVRGAASTFIGLSFSTSNNAAPVEVARIDPAGNLLVGTTSSAGGAKFAVKATASTPVIEAYATNASYVSSLITAYADSPTTNGSFNAFLYYNVGEGTTRFAVRDSGNVVNTNNSYGAISDLKLKENIVDASPKLAKLMQVRIVNYNLKSDPDKTKLIGVIAQELEQISPGLIEETPDFEEVKKTREITKSVPVTEQVTVQREQRTVTVVDGKAVVTVTVVDEQIEQPVFDHYPLFDADGNPVMEVETPEVPEVLDADGNVITDADGNVITPAAPATYRQSMHSVPRMRDVVEVEEYTERVPTGTNTKSVKYSVFVPMLIKALQEQQAQIVALTAQQTAIANQQSENR